MPAQEYTITLRPVPPGWDRLNRTPEQRLRAILKTALRRDGLRCVKIEPKSLGPSQEGGSLP